MHEIQAEKLALRFAAKIIQFSPATIFNDNRLNPDVKAKQLSDFVAELAKNFENNLSEFKMDPKID